MNVKSATTWMCDGCGVEEKYTVYMPNMPQGWAEVTLRSRINDSSQRLHIMGLCTACQERMLDVLPRQSRMAQ